jgi:hypothetical protein
MSEHIGVGDGGQVGNCPQQQFMETIFFWQVVLSFLARSTGPVLLASKIEDFLPKK